MSDTPQATDPRAPWTEEERAKLEWAIADPFVAGSRTRTCKWCNATMWLNEDIHHSCLVPQVKKALAHITALEARLAQVEAERDEYKAVVDGVIDVLHRHCRGLRGKDPSKENLVELSEAMQQTEKRYQQRAQKAEADRDALAQRVAELQLEIQRFSERGIYPNGDAPNDERATYDRGFKSAMAHVAIALRRIVIQQPRDGV